MNNNLDWLFFFFSEDSDSMSCDSNSKHVSIYVFAKTVLFVRFLPTFWFALSRLIETRPLFLTPDIFHADL